MTANNCSRPYGAANPAFSSGFSGFINGETLATSGITGSPSLTTTAAAGSPVSGGPYTIVAAIGSLNALNYSFVFVNGTLTVTKAVTVVNIVSGLNPARTNQNMTFTATVNPVAPSIATPAGAVQFKSNGANLGGPVSLAGGQGSVTVSGSILGAGSFNITAEYSDPAGNFNSSTNGLNQSDQQSGTRCLQNLYHPAASRARDGQPGGGTRHRPMCSRPRPTWSTGRPSARIPPTQMVRYRCLIRTRGNIPAVFIAAPPFPKTTMATNHHCRF